MKTMLEAFYDVLYKANPKSVGGEIPDDRSYTMIRKKSIGVILFWLIIWQTVYIVIGNDVLFASPNNTVCEIIKLFCVHGIL